VAENLNSGTEVGAVSAVDDDLSPHNAFVYHIEKEDNEFPNSPPSINSQFVIDPHTGVIYTRKTLDREALSHYTLRVRVDAVAQTNSGGRENRNLRRGGAEGNVHSEDLRRGGVGGNAQSDYAVVFVSVTDVNDNAPRFIFPIPDGAGVLRLRRHGRGKKLRSDGKTFMTTISARDPDEGRNAELTYLIAAGDDDGSFHVDSKTGELTWMNTSQSATTSLSSQNCAVSLTLMVRDSGLWPPGPMIGTTNLLILFDDCESPLKLTDDSHVTMNGSISPFQILIVGSVLTGCVILGVIVAVAVYAVRRQESRARELREMKADKQSNESISNLRTNDRFGVTDRLGPGGERESFTWSDGGSKNEGEGGAVPMTRVVLYLKGQDAVGRVQVSIRGS